MEEFVQADLWVQLVLFIPLGAYLLVAAIWDGVTSLKSEIRKGRIPNKLSYSSVLVGIACHTIVGGLDGFLSGLIAVALVFGVGIFLAALGWLGGGDVKLLMGVGAFLGLQDRKSTRLNSSHVRISYAVCCLKKKNNTERTM